MSVALDMRPSPPRDDREERDPNGWIWTASGRKAWPMELRPTDIDIDDVAHALAHLCRYAGHCRFFYSVAQHSVLVSELVEAWTTNQRLALAGLLHDATEAFLIDLPRPVKHHRALAGYREAERRAEQAIAERFGLSPALFAHGAIKGADEVMLATERRDLFAKASADWRTDKQPTDARIDAMGPDEARASFLHRFHVLTRAVRP